MKRLTVLSLLLLSLFSSSQGWTTPYVIAYHRGGDGWAQFIDGETIHTYPSSPHIDLDYITGQGYGLPYHDSYYTYNIDYGLTQRWTGTAVPIWFGTGQHNLTIQLIQYNLLDQEVTVATASYNFTLAYPVPVAPTISGSTSNNHPVISWSDIGYWAVQQNTTNGYEIYRRDYQVRELWHDWTKIASLSGTTTSYTDQSVHALGQDLVEYKVRAVDISSPAQASDYSNVISFTAELNYKIFAGGIPGQFSLKESYPNPFNPSTHLQYDLPVAGNVSLQILDVQGREVKTLAAGFSEAGSYNTAWNAENQSTGVYFARLVVTNQLGKVVYKRTNKLLLTR